MADKTLETITEDSHSYTVDDFTDTFTQDVWYLYYLDDGIMHFADERPAGELAKVFTTDFQCAAMFTKYTIDFALALACTLFKDKEFHIICISAVVKDAE